MRVTVSVMPPKLSHLVECLGGSRASRLRVKVFTTAFPEWSTVNSFSRPPATVPLGSQSFVESHFYNLKHKLGYQRRRPATRLIALGCDTLWVFRDLRVRPIG